MNKFVLALILMFAKYMFAAVFGFAWQVFDPLLILVIVFTYFHSFDMPDYLGYAIFCGLLSDITSADIFGLHILLYCACVFIVVAASRLLYRHNWVFIFPVIFLTVFLSFPFVLLLKAMVFKAGANSMSALFIFRIFCESLAAVLWAYPIYLFSKRCACELIA